jgi:hypothetical protein
VDGVPPCNEEGDTKGAVRDLCVCVCVGGWVFEHEAVEEGSCVCVCVCVCVYVCIYIPSYMYV